MDMSLICLTLWKFPQKLMPEIVTRLWKDVTLSLKRKDVQEATKYKQMLEQRQREEAKHRAETGEPIHHKVR